MLYIQACLKGIYHRFKVWRKWRTRYQYGPPISLPITLGHFHSIVICFRPNWFCKCKPKLKLYQHRLNFRPTANYVWSMVVNPLLPIKSDRQTIFQTVEKCNPICQNTVWSLVSPITLRLEVVVSTLMITLRNTNMLHATYMICTHYTT